MLLKCSRARNVAPRSAYNVVCRCDHRKSWPTASTLTDRRAPSVSVPTTAAHLPGATRRRRVQWTRQPAGAQCKVLPRSVCSNAAQGLIHERCPCSRLTVEAPPLRDHRLGCFIVHLPDKLVVLAECSGGAADGAAAESHAALDPAHERTTLDAKGAHGSEADQVEQQKSSKSIDSIAAPDARTQPLEAAHAVRPHQADNEEVTQDRDADVPQSSAESAGPAQSDHVNAMRDQEQSPSVAAAADNSEDAAGSSITGVDRESPGHAGASLRTACTAQL